MIDKKQVKSLIDSHLEGKDIFLVDYSIDDANRIRIEIDGNSGVKIQDCVDLSRFVEHQLDREANDFELQVSSPGLDQPFKVYEQYVKCDGREVEVVLKGGEKLKGLMSDVNKDNFTLEVSRKERIEGKKKKQIITEKKQLSYSDVATAKQVISFK